jgi:hypothetical protein
MPRSNAVDGSRKFFDLVADLSAKLAGGAAADGAQPAGASTARSADAAERGFHRLEPTDSNLKCQPASDPWGFNWNSVGFAAVVPCKCRCRTCGTCGPLMGWRVRQCLLSKAERFQNPAMLSLTVDRRHFASPQEAHHRITKGSFIARLMRLLGIATWFWVLEFQTKTGDGWPHWHLLIDLADVHNRLNLPRAWHLWRDKWKLGGLDLSVKRSFAEPAHAVHYVTKYLTKMPEAFPVWVIQSQNIIRFIGGCKSLGSLTGQPPRDAESCEPDPQMKLFKEPRTALIVRMSRCGETASVFCVDGDSETGEGGRSWMATIKARPMDLMEMGEQGLISLRFAAVDFGEKELLAISDTSIGGVVSALRRVQSELEDREVGYAEAWADEMRERETRLFKRHEEFWQGRAA